MDGADSADGQEGHAVACGPQLGAGGQGVVSAGTVTVTVTFFSTILSTTSGVTSGHVASGHGVHWGSTEGPGTAEARASAVPGSTAVPTANMF